MLIRAALVGGALAVPVASVQAQPGGATPVAVSKAVVRDVAAAQTFVGTVMPVKRAVVGSAVDGRVVEFRVKQGDSVAKGQPLAQLLTETLQHELNAARANLQLRQAELEELENGTRPEEIAQAKARMHALEAQKRFAQTRYDRIERLYAQGSGIAASKDEFDEAFSQRVNAEQTFLEAKEAYELARLGPRREKIAQARARVAEQQALAEQIADQIGKHTVITRFDGYVVTEHTEEGQWVKRGDPVAEVVALDEVEVQAHVLDSHVPHVRVGMSARIEIAALPNDVLAGLPTDALLGEVVRVVPQADLRTRTFPVKVRLDNPLAPADAEAYLAKRESVRSLGPVVGAPAAAAAARLVRKPAPLFKAGMLARVTLSVGPEEKALLVSKDALVLGGPQPVVCVVDPDPQNPKQGTARIVAVRLGVADEGLIQVTGQIEPGQLVVVQGNERLRDGQAVVISRELPPSAGPTVRAIDSSERTGD